ncbi:MAG: Streptopain precursor [Bacteroidetes bacterium ADurb.Bin408]|nr:MAG: Streptopain precursor [Bacteroidetes bacterium ADurb.Bin408]
MGQLMFYHRWPKTGTGNYAYNHPVYGTIQSDFQNTTFDWESMPNSIAKPNKAIAELLFNCGVSVDMDYGPNGSGMWNHSAARSLRNYFKYGPETEYIFRDSTTLDWDSILIANLDNLKPLYYAGWTQNPTDSSGHAFVCDGYQGLGYYHFNWGWGGSYDGFFYLNQLTPGGADFNFRQEVIKDIYPDTVNYTFPLHCTGPDTLHEIMGSIEDGSGILNYGNNASCSWLIAPDLNVSNIKLTFDYIDTEPTNDIIRVYNGETTASPLLGTYSGTNTPATITVNGKKMLVTFTTNDSVTSGGFRATYTATTPVYCTAMTTLTNPSDTISDGSSIYPYNYLTNCRWRITPPGAEVITIDFVSFELDSGTDYLEIYDMNNSPAVLLDTYTGYSLPTTKSYNTGNLMVWFKTNTYEPKSGWKFFYNSSASGIANKTEDASLNIYPNPASEAIYIDYKSPCKGSFDVHVYASDGREVFRADKNIAPKGYTNLLIPVLEWSNGLYVVRLINEKKIFYQKLIINHKSLTQ